MEASWLGRYGKHDEAIKTLLTEQEGWLRYRDMDLFEAIRLFSETKNVSDRIGLARAYLEMARTFERLDRLFLGVETSYLVSRDQKVTGAQRARLGFVVLRRGELARAQEIFGQPAPKGQERVWSLGHAGIALARKDSQAAAPLLKGLCAAADEDGAQLVRVATTLWGVPQRCSGDGYYIQALDAIEGEDLFGGVVALQMMDHASARDDAGPDLYLYPLLERIFARLALETVESLEQPQAAYLKGLALLHMGTHDAAVEAFEAAAVSGEPLIEMHLFGPLLDGREVTELARFQQGVALSKAGKGQPAQEAWSRVDQSGDQAVALTTLAAAQRARGLDAPLSSPEQAAALAREATKALRQSAAALEGGEEISVLLSAREAEVARLGARIALRDAKAQDALDLIDGVHRKRKGYRPDFVNPPSFMVELSQAYAETGQYAPAVEILFELSHEVPSSRLGYESLKRLYASRSGGEAPPR